MLAYCLDYRARGSDSGARIRADRVVGTLIFQVHSGQATDLEPFSQGLRRPFEVCAYDVSTALISQLLLGEHTPYFLAGIALLPILLPHPGGWLTIHQLSDKRSEHRQRVRAFNIGPPHPRQAFVGFVSFWRVPG